MKALDWVADARYGIHTRYMKNYEADDRKGTAAQDATRNIPMLYHRLFVLRRYLKPSPADVFIDLGCGTGRPLFVMAYSDAGVIRGVDFHEVAVRHCTNNLAHYRGPKSKIIIYRADCATLCFTNETIFYLYNPFGPVTLAAVLKRIHNSITRNFRPIRICFYETEQRKLLDESAWLVLEKTLPFPGGRFLIYSSHSASA